jgi:putative ABC transport system permease protein
MVRGETAGTVLGLFGAQLLADMLISMGISPDWLTVTPSLHWTVLAPLAHRRRTP